MLELKNIKKIYSMESNSVTAIEDLSFCFPKTGFVALVGESGCGKTTLLNILSGLDVPTSGSVIYDNKDISGFSKTEWEKHRNMTMGFVFQDYNIFDNLTVFENVSLPLSICNIEGNSNEEIVNAVLNDIGIIELKDRLTATLSGGQKQRVALCRALVNKPDVLLADEPTGNLDSKNSEGLFRLLKKVSEDTLVIVATHDRNRAATFADTYVEMEDGAIVNVEYPGQYSTSFSVSNDSFIREFVHYTEFEHFLKDDIGNSREEKDYRISIRRHAKVNNKHNKTDRPLKNPIVLSKENIKKYSDRILIKRKTRQRVTAFSFALGFFLMLSIYAVLFYNEKAVNLFYVDKYKGDTTFISREKSYFSDRGKTAYVSTTTKLKSHLTDIVGEDNIVLKKNNGRIETIGQYDVDNSFVLGNSCEEICIYVLSDEAFNKRANIIVDDQGECGIIITDYLASKLLIDRDNLGELMFLNSFVVRLSGIKMTDYEKVVPLLRSDNPSDMYTLKNVYSAVYVSQSYLESLTQQYKESRIKIKGNCFFSVTPRVYLNTEISISAFDENQTIILSGRSPRAENEVVVSEEIAEKCGLVMATGRLTEKEYTLLNIYDSKYNNNFGDCLNLYDYFGEKLIVVGITEDAEADVYLPTGQYVNLVTDYSHLFFFDEIGVTESALSKEINSILKKGYYVSDENLSYSEGLTIEFETIRPIALFFLLIIVLLLSFMMILNIRFEIKDNYYNIGVLKSMGVTEKDITRLFLYKPRIILRVAVTIGIFLFLIFIVILNLKNAYNLGYRKYVSLIVEWTPIIVSSAIFFAAGLLLAWLPIKEASKRAVIRVIKA